jgi:crotonobetainyl-CoA:carnitine CoA-transferase CaiB-like acyl-CoA transferase
LQRVNPRLIYVSISGFGATGPAAGERVYDPVVQCVSGFAAAQGAGGDPQLVRTIASDKIAALTAAQAISSALFARATGSIGGHHVELSMLDASLAFLWPEVYWNHSFGGEEGVTRKPLIADFYRLLRTADGFITVIIVGDGEFAGACRALDLPELGEDPRFRTLGDRFTNYAALFAAMEPTAATRSSDALIERLRAEDVPCARVNRFEDVFEDPRVTHRQSIVEYDHPQAGRLRQARAPAIFDGEPCGVRRPSPALGEHTAELLAAVGCDAAEIAAWRAVGAIN